MEQTCEKQTARPGSSPLPLGPSRAAGRADRRGPQTLLQGRRMLGRVQVRKAKVSTEHCDTAGLAGLVFLCISMQEVVGGEREKERTSES
ncbi:hypothetical protein SKAU_G00229250 [Synaphobranchus kaupii]|uniref:Uncharacterized protein n=1 Tax=Synaphobranchus kaupii TaxID=118154 RepID=A0A9Q1F5Q0_SYNKA|nr:hypothetical protein SKAU_G00229250 [Synaphobranchus kaupii]